MEHQRRHVRQRLIRRLSADLKMLIMVNSWKDDVYGNGLQPHLLLLVEAVNTLACLQYLVSKVLQADRAELARSELTKVHTYLTIPPPPKSSFSPLLSLSLLGHF